MRIDIYSYGGNIESYEPVPMGPGFGSGNVMSTVFLKTKDMREHGIRIVTGYYSPSDEGVSANYVIDEKLLVAPDDIDLIYKVKMDNVTIMGPDENGMLLNPCEYDMALNAPDEDAALGGLLDQLDDAIVDMEE